MPVVGFLHSGSPASYAPSVASFLQALSETGYVEGRNVTVEYRWAEIWNNETMQAMRRAHASGDESPFPECVDCSYSRPKLPLIIGGFMLDPFLAGRLMPIVGTAVVLAQPAPFSKGSFGKPSQPHSQAYERDQENFLTAEDVRHGLCLCALVLAGILPFAARAVYLDEPQYLHVAKAAILHNWRFPQDTSWVFFGKNYANLAAQTHLPVAVLMTALLKLVGRFDEVRFRLLFAIFPLLAVLSFYRLARRFTANPLTVSCLFAASPAFFVLSPTLMMDIPMLAFFLAGVAFYLDGMDRAARLWASSTCFLLAAGTGYTVMVPLGCLFIWAVASSRHANGSPSLRCPRCFSCGLQC